MLYCMRARPTLLCTGMKCPSCGRVKQEKLPWVADKLVYTTGLAGFVGRRCRTAATQAVARELPLDWQTVKELDKQYRRE